jgi:hypothetical protein
VHRQAELGAAQSRLQQAQERVTQLEEQQAALARVLTSADSMPASPRTPAAGSSGFGGGMGSDETRDLLSDVRSLQDSLIRTKLAYAEAEHQKELQFMEARDARRQLAAVTEVSHCRGGCDVVLLSGVGCTQDRDEIEKINRQLEIELVNAKRRR